MVHARTHACIYTYLSHTIRMQGKSRSTTAIIAYLMALDGGRNYAESLNFVQERRRMANPNPTFSRRLQDFARSASLKKLRRELSES